MDEILKRQEYCGDELNLKTHSKSFKNHRRIDNPKEDWLIFENIHEHDHRPRILQKGAEDAR